MQTSDKPIGIVTKRDYLESRGVMVRRCEDRRRNLPFYQQKALKVILDVCDEVGIREIQTEKKVFCESVKRFYAIDIFIPSLRLGFELDGKQHQSHLAYDQARDQNLLEDWGIVILRYDNSEISKPHFKKQIQDIISEQAAKKKNGKVAGFKRDLTRCLFNKHDFFDLVNREKWCELYREFNGLSKCARRKLLRYGQVPNHLMCYFQN